MATGFGWVGVQVFFLVSGLVIAFSARASEGRPWRFLRSRVLRLVPAVLISTVLAVLVEFLVFGLPPGTAVIQGIRTILFWPLPPWIMGQFWTIGIELVFYAMIFGLLSTGRFNAPDRLGAALIMVSLAYWIIRLSTGGIDPIGRVTALLLLQHGAYFGMGVLLSEIASRGHRRWHVPVILAGLLTAALQIRVAAYWEVGEIGVAWAWPIAFATFSGCILAAAASLRWNDAVLRRVGDGGPRGCGCSES